MPTISTTSGGWVSARVADSGVCKRVRAAETASGAVAARSANPNFRVIRDFPSSTAPASALGMPPSPRI